MPTAGDSALTAVLDRPALRRSAGARTFARGEDGFASGQVRVLAEHEGTLTATVLGTREYNVKLWVESGAPGYSCTCPVGADGVFCKHCVAVGLAWLAQGDEGEPVRKKAAKPAVSMNDVRAWLAGQDKDALVDMLMQHAIEDDRLCQRLLLKTANARPGGPDLATFRTAIADAVRPSRFVGYREMHDYARRIEDAVDSVAELLKEGHAVEVIDLAEDALSEVERAMGSVDDSDGTMGGILKRLQDLHLDACKKAKPEPGELARRLFESELGSEWSTFYDAAETYAEILGKKGLAVYRNLAEAEWAGVPALVPGRDDPGKYGKRLRITRIMETLARQSGDVEAIVAVKKRDLSSAVAYLRIAEAYKEAQKNDLALEWAERGLSAFPARADSGIRKFLAEEYHGRNRHDEAMALVWNEFKEQSALPGYKNLKSHADRIGEWSVWREKALASLREQIAMAKQRAPQGRRTWLPLADHSALVQIFLWEKDVEAAWSEALAGGCSSGLWMELAALRENDHPEDALPLYQRHVEETVDAKNNDAYRTAVGVLRKVRGLMLRLKRDAAFDEYLASLRVTHKPKRNFIKLLDHAKWD